MTLRVAIAYNFNDRDWLGGRNYFGSLFRALEAIAPTGVKILLVVGKRTQTTLPQEFPWIEVVRTSLMDRLYPLWLARQVTLRVFDVDPLLAWFLRQHRVDVLSHSNQLGAWSGIKTIPWLYDFQFMHLPEYWDPKHIRWCEQRYNAACKYGDAIIVSSYHALSDLEEFAPWCKLPKHVLQFVSNPVDFDCLPSKANIVQKYALPDTYFYLPNQFWTNKNHKLAIDALAHLKNKGILTTIVCTGKTFDARKPNYFEELMQHCKDVGVIDRFKVLGIVPYTDLQGLMAYACAVINPSRFEGWSTTVEEAKTLQQRLLLSDIAVHREQAPRFGRFFGKDDVMALAQLIEEATKEGTRVLSPAKVHADYANRLMAYGHSYLRVLTVTVGNTAVD